MEETKPTVDTPVEIVVKETKPAKRAFDWKKMLAVFTPNVFLSRRTRSLLAIAVGFLALILWVQWPDPMIPKPHEVVGTYPKLWSQYRFVQSIVASFGLNLAGLSLATFISLMFCYASKIPAVRPIARFISICRYIGLAGISFVFVRLFDGGFPLKLALLTYMTTPYFVTSMLAEIDSIPSNAFDHAKTLRMGPWRELWEVVILGTLHRAFDIMRQNAAIGWMMIMSIEAFVQTGDGIGVLLYKQEKYFHLNVVFAVIVSLLMMALTQDSILKALRNKFFRYAKMEEVK